MRTVICINDICAQKGVTEYFMGAPEKVMCGACQTICQLSEQYEDPEQAPTEIKPNEAPTAD
jgi:hypothetical protein